MTIGSYRHRHTGHLKCSTVHGTCSRRAACRRTLVTRTSSVVTVNGVKVLQCRERDRTPTSDPLSWLTLLQTRDSLPPPAVWQK